MPVTVITAPTSEPVTLAEAKAQIGVTTTDDDDLITRKIRAARQHVEAMTGRTLLETTLELVLDRFPRGALPVPRGPLASITSVKYLDPDGVQQTLATTGYTVDTDGDRIGPVDCWPGTASTINAVRVRYVAGLDAADDLPEPLREAVLMMVGHLYENREASLVGVNAQDLPFGVVDLVAGYRSFTFGLADD